jgi:inosine/xanthosine triphosphate pyrophosphatase family protein/diadenosine tetraphosphate (Ap4A) HIT family hydrolase
MLTLVTTNPAKYEPFAQDLERMRISLVPPKAEVPELQCLSFDQALAHKARAMADLFGHPVLVDDAGLVLEAYRPFPGPLTSVLLQSVGQAGLKRMLTGISDRASMECHLGWWNHECLKSWSGAVPGRLDCCRTPAHPRMLLSQLFIPDEPTAGPLAHRAQALAQLKLSAFELHLDTSGVSDQQNACSIQTSNQCPFCIEIEGTGQSIFSEMLGDQLPSRVLYEDDDFVVMPPLGQFIEGGLLVLSRQHFPSFAYLPPDKLERVGHLLTVIRRELAALYGTAPVIFEHGSAPQRSKGVCCVDHAHFNIFPAKVLIDPHLTQRMSVRLQQLQDMIRLRRAEFGYLLVLENDGSIRGYDGQLVPTQLVRRIITAQLGLPERWHWKDYPGTQELLATYNALHGKIRL